MSVLKGDGQVCVDGLCFNDLDLSFCPEGFHALQWYDNHGEVEYVTAIPNTEIKELGIYEQAYNVWKEAKRTYEVQEQERIQKELELAKQAEEERARQEYLRALEDERIRQQDLATAEQDALLEFDPEG
jgi:hypothetical protein